MDKRLFALGAAAMMAAGGVSPVLAEETAKDTNKDATLEYTVDETYEWSIHKGIDFGANAGVNQSIDKDTDKENGKNTVAVTKNVLREGKKLHITLKGSGTGDAFTIQNGAAGKEVLSYAVTGIAAGAIDVNGIVLDVASGTNTGSDTLIFTLSTTNKTAEVAGEYTGSVTYTAAVVDAQ